jgi:hypothetical protein
VHTRTQLVCFCESAHLFVPGVITHVFQSRGVHRASIVPHDFSALARLVSRNKPQTVRWPSPALGFVDTTGEGEAQLRVKTTEVTSFDGRRQTWNEDEDVRRIRQNCSKSHLCSAVWLVHVLSNKPRGASMFVEERNTNFCTLNRQELYTTLVEHHSGQMYYEGLQEAMHALDATRAPPEWIPFNQVCSEVTPGRSDRHLSP